MDSLGYTAQSSRGNQVALSDTSALTTVLQEFLLCCDMAMGATQASNPSPQPQADLLFDLGKVAPSILPHELPRSSHENASTLLPENLLTLYFINNFSCFAQTPTFFIEKNDLSLAVIV